MINRLKLSKKINNIVLCTSNNLQDNALEKIAIDNGVDCYRGDPDDVLLRMLNAAEEYNLDYILTITADCPFVDPYYADNIVNEYLKTDADLIRQFDLPHGAFSYGIKVNALKKVVALKDSSDTEVWGRYFTDSGLFNVLDLKVKNKHHNRPGLRMTLDYPEDFEFFKEVFNHLYIDKKVFSLTKILNLLDENPEIVKINESCGQEFKKRFSTQSDPKFKKIQKVKSALIIGAGSIGRRHIKNLKKIGINKIIALRSNKGYHQILPKKLSVIEVYNWEDIEFHRPDIAIISNPSSLHLKAASKVLKYVKGVFIEKPISNSLDGCQELIDQLQENGVVSFIGFNLMFHPIVKNIINFRNKNDVGNIVNIQCQVGQWLPDWHPYEDYKKAYYARKDLGGGVALTMIHEIHLALELAGLPLHVYGEITDYEKLDLEVDVCSDLMIKHKTSAVSHIHLDYLQQPSHRNGTISFEKGWLSYDFNTIELIGQIRENKTSVIWSDTQYDFNQMYIDQIQEFVRFVEERRMKHKFDAISSIESLKVVNAHFESAKIGKKVNIERNERFCF
jgi:spore coat polysaccharide biosynthesis protein SpsF (cytidylyltransferase family)/predicted dehydrogenase